MSDTQTHPRTNPLTQTLPYAPRRIATSRMLPLRGLHYHLLQWGTPQPGQPLLLLMHGWMDVAASFQFMVDAMQGERCIVAADWRGFGRSLVPAGTDAYWFPDYLGDLDALVDALSPDQPIDLLGHSMGGNVVMSYAGVRPQRVRKLVNLEGFGLPDADPATAPQRLATWLDELKTPQRLKPYASLADVAQRLRANNPRLHAGHALWLAQHWAAEQPDGSWALQADSAHKRSNPVPYRAAEVVATWSAISAPLLWVQGDSTQPERHWGGRYSLAEFQTRLACVPNLRQQVLLDAGHMLHHDQPAALAAVLDDFLR